MPNRSGILNLATWATQPVIALRIGYSLDRPMDIEPTQHQLEAEISTSNADGSDVIGWDCSASIKWLYLHSGSKSPDGDEYGADYGNTETIAAFLTDQYSETVKALTGAIGIYGLNLPLAEQHAILYMTEDGQPDNPWVFSHGSEAGPLRLRLSDETTAHPGADFTWCSVGGL